MLDHTYLGSLWSHVALAANFRRVFAKSYADNSDAVDKFTTPDYVSTSLSSVITPTAKEYTVFSEAESLQIKVYS